MSRAAGCLVLLAVLAITGCGDSGKSKRRDVVNAYLDRVETIQQRFAPSFALANQAYGDFSKAKPTPREIQRLRGAEVSILAARDTLQRVGSGGLGRLPRFVPGSAPRVSVCSRSSIPRGLSRRPCALEIAAPPTH